MGTEQDTQRAEQLYQQAARQGDETAKLLSDKLYNWKGRGCLDMDLWSEQPHYTVVVEQPTPLMCLVCHNNHREMDWNKRCGCVGTDAADACAAHNAVPAR